jgi:hypothetical protein
MSIIGAVVGYQNIDDKNKAFRVVYLDAKAIGDKQYKWQIRAELKTEADIVAGKLAVNPKEVKWLNIAVANGKVKGTTGDLNRFNNKVNNPHVIVTQIINGNGVTIGYKVLTHGGELKNVPLKEMIAYGLRVTKQNGIPVQNAIFIPADDTKRAHFKAYPGNRFVEESLVAKTKTAEATPSVPVKKNAETLNRLDEIYSKAQIEQLRLGKQSGVDIRIYANPELSAEQMKVLRGGLEKHINVKWVANKDYSALAMKAYIQALLDRIDIRPFLNPKYDVGQIGELALAAELGLDLSKMADPKYNANDMAEIRERLERKIWRDTLLSVDGKW